MISKKNRFKPDNCTTNYHQKKNKYKKKLVQHTQPSLNYTISNYFNNSRFFIIKLNLNPFQKSASIRVSRKKQKTIKINVNFKFIGTILDPRTAWC